MKRGGVGGRPPNPQTMLVPQFARAWLLGVALIVFVLTPSAFLVIYPRFGPVNTMTAFCTAEGEGEYATAYALLSKGAQQRVSLDAFTQTSHGVNLISCAPSRGIPLILGGDAGQSGCDHPNDWRRRARRVNVVCP